MLILLSVMVLGLMVGCGGVGQPPAQCGAGEQHFVKGCGDGPDFKAGCYATCSASKTCPSGSTCTKVSVQPACASAAGPGQAVCGACGQGASICLPIVSGQPPPPKNPKSCEPSAAYYEPGCGDGAKIKAGCYESCTSDSQCAADHACQKVSVNPCPVSKDGISCGACGKEETLCVPKPKPAACKAGMKRFEPGCGDNSIKAGCYKTCDEKNPCGPQEECRAASVKPDCPRDTNGIKCDACGSSVKVCMPKRSTATCSAGQEFHTPGCSNQKNEFKAGCYTPCQKGQCSAGMECKKVTVTPECAKQRAPGAPVCNACGAAKELCFPKAP